MAAKKQAPSLTRLKEILRQSSFDPRSNEGPLSVITETVLINPSYAENRAIELIREGQRILSGPISNPAKAFEDYQKITSQAMALLALGIAVRE